MALNINAVRTVKADEGAVMQVVDSKTEEVIPGVTITLLGQDSKVYRKIQLARSQAILNRAAKGKKGVDLDAEKMADDTIDDLVKLTVTWTGFEEDGKPLDATPENFARIYGDPGLSWLKEQVQEFVADRTNFFRSDD
jgi:hypothetical protein